MAAMGVWLSLVLLPITAQAQPFNVRTFEVRPFVREVDGPVFFPMYETRITTQQPPMRSRRIGGFIKEYEKLRLLHKLLSTFDIDLSVTQTVGLYAIDMVGRSFVFRGDFHFCYTCRVSCHLV